MTKNNISDTVLSVVCLVEGIALVTLAFALIPFWSLFTCVLVSAIGGGMIGLGIIVGFDV